ncbi:MAG: hypothetical protein ACOCXA_03720 [Planctomycetota bacterium]
MIHDYSWYFSAAHIERTMYGYLPTAMISMNNASEADYEASESEDWTAGALRFDGSRYGVVTDADIDADALISLQTLYNRGKGGQASIRGMQSSDNLWTVDEPSDGYDADDKPPSTQRMISPAIRVPSARVWSLQTRTCCWR